MSIPSVGNTSVVNVEGQCTSLHHITAKENIENTN